MGAAMNWSNRAYRAVSFELEDVPKIGSYLITSEPAVYLIAYDTGKVVDAGCSGDVEQRWACLSYLFEESRIVVFDFPQGTHTKLRDIAEKRGRSSPGLIAAKALYPELRTGKLSEVGPVWYTHSLIIESEPGASEAEKLLAQNIELARQEDKLLPWPTTPNVVDWWVAYFETIKTYGRPTIDLDIRDVQPKLYTLKQGADIRPNPNTPQAQLTIPLSTILCSMCKYHTVKAAGLCKSCTRQAKQILYIKSGMR